MTNDKLCLEVCRKNIERAGSWYVMASYAYYVEDDPIITDECFEKLAKMLLKAYPTLPKCITELIKEETLRAGTYLGEYPGWVPGVVELTRANQGRKSTPSDR